MRPYLVLRSSTEAWDPLLKKMVTDLNRVNVWAITWTFGTPSIQVKEAQLFDPVLKYDENAKRVSIM